METGNWQDIEDIEIESEKEMKQHPDGARDALTTIKGLLENKRKRKETTQG